MKWITAKTVLEIRLSNAFKPLSGKSDLVSLLSKGKKQLSGNDFINIRDDSKKLIVSIDKGRISIIAETGDIEKDLKLAHDVLKTINNSYPISSISRIGIRTFNYCEIKSDAYEDFVERFKKIYYNPTSSITNNSDDVGVSLLFNKTNTINVNIGPMKEKEIFEKFLSFKLDEELPNYYLMGDVDVFATRSDRYTNSFIERYESEAATLNDKYLKEISRDWVK